jgi:hypothetical protein
MGNDWLRCLRAALCRRSLNLGPIGIGVGVSMICGSVAIMLTRSLTPVSLAAAITALIAGTCFGFSASGASGKTKRQVLPLARALQEAALRKQSQRN